MRSSFESEKMRGVDIAEGDEGRVVSSGGGRFSEGPKSSLGILDSRDEYARWIVYGSLVLISVILSDGQVEKPFCPSVASTLLGNAWRSDMCVFIMDVSNNSP